MCFFAIIMANLGVNNMKKELKRYYLVEYYGERETTLDNIYDVKDMINEIRKFNNRKSSKFLFGNVTLDKVDEKYHLTAHVYRKYTEKSKISDIDAITSKLSEDELEDLYKEKSKMKDGYKPDINIAYLETENKDEKGTVKYERGIKYLPVLYKEDIKYMDPAYIRECLYYHANIRDYEFFREFASALSLHHFVSDEVSELLTVVDKCEHQGVILNSLYFTANKLYSKFILEYEKDESLSRNDKGEYIKSRRRLRDAGFFVKNYGIRESKKRSPLCYNLPLPESQYIEEENGQLKLKLK